MIKYLFLICLLTAFSITNAQNVGIGTSNPTEKLHVVGNVKADTLKPSAFKLTSGAGLGKVLTSDAAGMQWESQVNFEGRQASFIYHFVKQ